MTTPNQMRKLMESINVCESGFNVNGTIDALQWLLKNHDGLHKMIVTSTSATEVERKYPDKFNDIKRKVGNTLEQIESANAHITSTSGEIFLGEPLKMITAVYDLLTGNFEKGVSHEDIKMDIKRAIGELK